MTTEANIIEPGDPANLNAEPAMAEAVPDIVSVNRKGTSDNKVAKAVFVLLVGALLVGFLAWFGQNWLNARKAQMKAGNGPHAAEDTSQMFNPEKTGAGAPKPKLGAESGVPPPSQATVADTVKPGAGRDDGIRPLRGADGKVMVNPQGRAMGVDKDGNVVDVPAITALANESGRTPLPGQAAGQSQGQGNGQPPPKPPSRYAGSLFVGDAPKPANATSTSGSDGTGVSPAGNTIAQKQAQQIADILRSAGLGAPQGTSGTPAQGSMGAPLPGQSPGASFNAPEQPRPGTVGSTLYSSSTPVALARRMSDQNLILPKGRQADCVLTGRIIDEVPGFTSCALVENLYSDNGRVLLLERGSELTGEYGVSNQLGLERLFVTWTRLKTPEGIEIDLSSPGADRLGTSGIPGNLDNRWGARIGAALILSFVKDVTVAIIASQTKDTSSGTSVNITPGQNTLNSSSALAEEVIKQTIKVRPRLTINEGDRISIYVARDLDFAPVYALKTAGIVGATRLLSK